MTSKASTRIPSDLGSVPMSATLNEPKRQNQDINMAMFKKSKYKGPKISFGTTKHREMFPTKCGDDRFSNELVPIRSPPSRYPGMYELDHKTSSHHMMNCHVWKPCSKYGKYLNRTEKMGFRWRAEEFPDPTHYAKDNSEVILPEDNYRPFNEAMPRFVKKRVDTDFTPGPGSYDSHKLWLNRRVTFPQEFGRPDRKVQVVEDARDVKHTLRTDHLDRKAILKRQNKLAYFKLYFE